MSWLRSTGSLRGQGPASLLQGSFHVPARVASSPAAAHARRISVDRTTRTLDFACRSFSTQKSGKDRVPTSRFRKPEASPAEPAVGTPAGRSQMEPATAPEPASPATRATSSASLRRASTGPGTSTPARKPVDTSSKEYKQAASRYVRFVVAFPFLIVTSYFLYERLAPEIKIRQVPRDSPASQEPRPAS